MKLTEKYLEMLPVKHCNFVKCDEMTTPQEKWLSVYHNMSQLKIQPIFFYV